MTPRPTSWTARLHPDHPRSLSPLVVAQVWAFVILLPELAPLGDPVNRYLLFFTVGYGALRLAVALGLGLLLLAAYQPVKKLPPVWLAGLLLLAGLLVAAAAGWRLSRMSGLLRRQHHARYVAALAAGLLGLAAFSIYRRCSVTRWVRWVGRASVFLSPVLPIFWFNVLTARQYAPPQSPDLARAGSLPRVAAAPAPTENVYLLLLDAWSVPLTFDGDQVRAELPALRRASRQMTVFHDAHAPGCHTMSSLPRLLFQRTDSFALRRGEPGFWDGQRFDPCRELDSIFVGARRRGFRTYLLGWYHPYADLVGTQADLVWSARHTDWIGPRPADQLRQIGYEAIYNLLGHALLERIHTGSPDPENAWMVHNTRQAIDHLQAIIDDPGDGQFVVSHLPLPHFRFVHNRHGPKPQNVRYPKGSLGDARDQLAYTDRILGAIFARLRRAGKYDRSTIVLTSDHTWRMAPGLRPGSGARWSHVPLMIKFPGQRTRIDVGAPFSTSRLIRLLSRARKPSEIPRTIRSGDYIPVPDSEADWSGIRPLLK